MASTQVAVGPPRMSFAKVAAMSVASLPPNTNETAEQKKAQPTEKGKRRKTMISTKPNPSQPPATVSTEQEPDVKTPQPVQVVPAIQGLANVILPVPPVIGTKSSGSGDSAADDQSHLSTSSTKQHSFETKSMASVTTFAMDEKESIRPDDSASVRAADEEEGGSTLSTNGTFHTEPGVIMPALRGSGFVGTQTALLVRRFHTLTNPPRFGTLEEPMNALSDEVDTTISSESTPAREGNQTSVPPPPMPPDEKLLDALASPKDRLSLLQLEEKLLAFIRQTVLEFIDLPPTHSYARLLAHKLADYYGLHHFINEDGTTIRVFRHTSATLPVPLATLAQSVPVGSNQTLGLTGFKIMRRGGTGRHFPAAESTAPSSSAPSKATSEAGRSEEGITSLTEASTPSRDRSKLTREEREAQYNAARERIFGNMEDLSIRENASNGENSAEMSRSSSSSGNKKKPSRKQKAPKDDSFDSRSAFVASYHPMHVQQMTQYHSQQQQQQQPEDPYQNQYQSPVGGYGQSINYGSTPTQAYPGFDQNMQFSTHSSYGPPQAQVFGNNDAWSPMQSPPAGGYYPYPQNAPAYQQNIGSVLQPITQQYPQQQTPTMQHPMAWNNQYQAGYQPAVEQHMPNMNWQSYQPLPQQFGQGQPGPVTGFNQFQVDNRTAVPAASSQQPAVNTGYSRASTLFNPQTKTFVPSNGPNRGGHRQNRKKHSPNSANHQSRQNSVARPEMSNDTSSASLQSLREQSAGVKAVNDSLQQKYGKPANLPKKPPPAQQLSQFDASSIQGVRSTSGSSSTQIAASETRG